MHFCGGPVVGPAAAATFVHMLIARRVLSARSITSNHRFHAPASSRDASLARAPVTFCDTTTYSAHAPSYLEMPSSTPSFLAADWGSNLLHWLE